jgi:hypothetical protein
MYIYNEPNSNFYITKKVDFFVPLNGLLNIKCQSSNIAWPIYRQRTTLRNMVQTTTVDSTV